MRQSRLREEEVKRTLEKLSGIENAVNNPLYDLNNQSQVKVNIRIDNNIAPARFKPDPLNSGEFLANELTFRAMKKDIFALGADVDELKEPYICRSCKMDLDLQFWHFCPRCGQQFER